MKILFLILIYIFSGQFLSTVGQQNPSTSLNEIQTTGSVSSNLIDIRDGIVYTTILIDSTLWMAQNLAYKPNSGNYWTFRNDERSIDAFGYLYDWETALDICPAGWELPSKEDFLRLINYTKEQYGIAYFSLISGGRSGIDLYSSGVKYGAYYVYVEGNTILWTCSENNKKLAWGFSIDGKEKLVNVYPTFKKKSGIPVRCIKKME